MQPSRRGRGLRDRRSWLWSGLAVLITVPLWLAPGAGAHDSGPTDGSSGHTEDSTGHAEPTGDASATTSEAEGFQHPEWIAGAALVRVETTATVTVSVALGGPSHTHIARIPPMPETTRTGTFIAPGIVLTSNAEVERRFHIRGVNQIFADYVGSRSESFSMTRAADPAIDAMLQDCYLPRRANPEHCLVDVRQDIVVRPYTRPARAIPVPRKASSRPHDPEVLFLVLADANTECRACPPITVDTLEDAVGTPVVAIAATGHDPLHPVFRARLTDDHEQPLTQEDEASAFRVLGPAAAGAPLISTHGAVAGMLVRDGDGVTALPADHIYDDAATEWRITPSTADYTHHVQEGVGALEGDDFTTAEEYFSEIVQNTGQTVVADLLERTRDRAAAAPEPSASAEPSSGSDTSFWPVALSAAVLAVLAGLVLLTTRMRRAGAGAGAGPRTDRGAGPVPGAVSPTPAGRADRAAGHDAGAGASHGDSHGEGRPVGSPPTGDAPAPTTGPPRAREETAPVHEVRYCTECGAGLAPGDRFCYSCGTPTARG